MFRELLLEKKNLDKIEIYQKLLTLDPDTYNLLWLSHFLDLSYSKTMSAISEIDIDLQMIDPNSYSIINENHKIILTDDLPPEEALTTYLIQQDIPYHFLIEIVEDNYEHLNEFSCKNFASPSTVRRKIAPLTKFLSQYGIHLRLSTMELSGDERIIRAVLASLLWVSSRGIEVPIGRFETTEVQQVVKKSMALTPNNDRVPSTPFFRKIDADIAYHRVRNGHYVKDDINYNMILHDDLLLEKTLWGEFIGAPPEHQYAETRYMAFRQFFGPVFFEADDPLYDTPREDLPKHAPRVYDFLLRFEKFINEDILDGYALSAEDKEKIHVLRGNLVMIFFNYLVFKTKVPFFYFLTEIEPLAKNRVYDSLYRKIESFLKKMAREPQVRWINYCIEDMCKIFTVLLLPEYELSAKQFNLNVSLVIEEQYIYNHKMEKFLKTLPYINFLPFDSNNMDQYDLIIASSRTIKTYNPKAEVIVFPYTMDERKFLDLRIRLKEMHIEKITF